MPLFYIWGHSFEFERENTWPLMEQLAEKLHGAQDIWYATNGQIADYLTALRSTRESADGKRLYNPSAQPSGLWPMARCALQSRVSSAKFKKLFYQHCAPPLFGASC